MSSTTSLQTIIISGASRGIGLELVKQALKAGHRVIAGARHPEKSELRELAASSQGRLIPLTLDITSDQSVNAFVAMLSKNGVDRVDVLMNNAGVYLKEDGKVDQASPSVVSSTFDTNVVGPLRLTHAMLPLLRATAGSRVCNTSSLMGSISDNSSGGALGYRISKTALNMYTKTFSLDERGITMVSLHPGWVQTDMGGAGAPVTPATSAAGLLKIALELKPSQTGKFFNYDGKELAW